MIRREVSQTGFRSGCRGVCCFPGKGCQHPWKESAAQRSPSPTGTSWEMQERVNAASQWVLFCITYIIFLRTEKVTRACSETERR